jgi:hypothetical protein
MRLVHNDPDADFDAADIDDDADYSYYFPSSYSSSYSDNYSDNPSIHDHVPQIDMGCDIYVLLRAVAVVGPCS